MARLSIEDVAGIAHEANRAYCQRIGDHSHNEWNWAPIEQRESCIEGVRKIVTGEITKPDDSHESWRAHKAADGWKYGEAKDPTNKKHPCMLPFSELPAEHQLKDQLFFNVVTALLPLIEAPNA